MSKGKAAQQRFCEEPLNSCRDLKKRVFDKRPG